MLTLKMLRLSSGWVRGLIALSIVLGSEYIYKHSPQERYLGVDYSNLELQLTFRLGLASAIILAATFFSQTWKMILGVLGISWTIVEFIVWYRRSYEVMHRPGIHEWTRLNSKFGLLFASWEHIIILSISVLLMVIVIAEVYKMFLQKPKVRY